MAKAHKTGNVDLRSIAHEAMLERGLLPDFSPAVMAETQRITTPAAASGAEIRDLRSLLWASIDNDDSRDLDQLSVAQPMADGTVRILVAISEVDALVKKDSAIDGHAWTNTTSVYTAAGIFPMLPEKLSTDLTSLGEGQERLAMVVDMAIATDGAVTDSDIYRAVGSAIAPSLPTTASTRGSRARRRRRQGSQPFLDWMSNCAFRIGPRRRCGACAMRRVR